jgi:hypothetical protein
MGQLTNLTELLISHNPLEHIPPEVNRLIDKIKKRLARDWHNHNIQLHFKESVFNFSREKRTTMASSEKLFSEIEKDDILTEKTKQLLLEYSKDESVHLVLGITFLDVLTVLWDRIGFLTNLRDFRKDIKTALNSEMQGSVGVCFTERLTRLLNCLNGFDDKVEANVY